MLEQTDEHYMDQLNRGRTEGMSALFERYHAAIYRYFFRQAGDCQLSQDLTQQVFVKAYERRASFSGREGMFRPWLYRIAHNLWIDHTRSTVSKSRITTELTESHEPAEVKDLNFTEAEFEMLDAALQQLPDDMKELIVLSKYQSLKYSEIAKITELTESAIKTRIHRAINRLREIYFQNNDK